MNKVIVSIIMGSDSDLPIMKEASDILDQFKVVHEVLVISAHRSPAKTESYAKTAVKRGIKVIIAGAGGAAHLAGVVAANVTIPVIGVPIKTSTLNGIDSLYSIVQMPPGVPVATVGINAAKNAAILAVEMLALTDKSLKLKIQEYKVKMAKSIDEKNKKLNELGIKNYLEQTKK